MKNITIHEFYCDRQGPPTSPKCAALDESKIHGRLSWGEHWAGAKLGECRLDEVAIPDEFGGRPVLAAAYSLKESRVIWTPVICKLCGGTVRRRSPN
jgi:hypothetical protein